MTPIIHKLSAILLLVAFSNLSFANEVQILSPKSGDKVGARVIVEGNASISDNSHVWVLAHVKLLQGQWWPQPRPVVDHEGNWQALVYIGEAQDVGLHFEISVATFNRAQETEILKYHEIGNKTGRWLPISFPKTTSKIDMVTVVKASH